MPESDQPINLTVTQRNDLRVACTLAEGGVPQASTGWTFDAQIRRMVDGELLAQLTVTVVDEAAGRFDLTLTAAQTAELPVGLWWWDCHGTDGTQHRTWGRASRVEVKPAVTRPVP